MFKTLIRFTSLALSLSIFILFSACSKDSPSSDQVYHIAVFVPGVVAGSPTYEMMVDGVKAAVDQANSEGLKADYKVVEAGYNQTEWLQSLSALASNKEYQLIVSSNPSLPDLAAEALKAFPQARFLIMDAYYEGNPAIKTLGFDQYQQGYLNGYLAGLLGIDNSAKAPAYVGLLAGQEYPVMNQQIRVGFLEGAQAVDPSIQLDFRVLGNWNDAGRAEELAKSQFERGAKVVLAIAGSGNQGVIQAARDKKGLVTWFDSPGFEFGPDVVLGGTLVKQTEFCTFGVLQAIKGELDFGSPQTFGIADGAIDYSLNPDFEAKFSPETRTRLQLIVEKFRNPDEFTGDQ